MPEDPVTDPVDRVLDGVGPRLRTLRRERGVTLAQLSTETGVSVSTLSRLESGLRRPTLELLLPLARAHQVPLDELVGVADAADPRVRARPVTRNGSVYLPLSRRPGGLQSYKIVIPERPLPPDPDLATHDGYDWFYVLSGRVRLLLGPHDLVLGPGEVVEFDCHVPHWFGNPGPGPAELLAIVGPQGERMHVRARATSR